MRIGCACAAVGAWSLFACFREVLEEEEERNDLTEGHLLADLEATWSTDDAVYTSYYLMLENFT